MAAAILSGVDFRDEAHRLRCNPAGGALYRRSAGNGSVRISDGRYGLRRRQALQLGGVEENPRYLSTAAGADGRGFRSVPGSPSCVLHYDDLLRRVSVRGRALPVQLRPRRPDAGGNLAAGVESRPDRENPDARGQAVAVAARPSALPVQAGYLPVTMRTLIRIALLVAACLAAGCASQSPPRKVERQTDMLCLQDCLGTGGAREFCQDRCTD